MAQRRYSVVIPVYNGEAFIGEALESVLTQSCPVGEIIVVDDGSSDDTVKVVESFGPKVALIRQKNQGVSVARNAGVSAMSGDWVAFLDADDAWEPTKIQSVDAAICEDRSYSVCVLNDRYYWSNGVRGDVEQARIDTCGDRSHIEFLRQIPTVPSCFSVRADVAKRVPFPPGVRNGEDQQYLVLVRQFGPFLHVPKPLTAYRVWPGQATAEANQRLLLSRVQDHLAFVARHSDLYREADRVELNQIFAELLALAHRNAYWRRDIGVAQQCRELYRTLMPQGPEPELFQRPLYPPWLSRVKDVVDSLRGRIGTRRGA